MNMPIRLWGVVSRLRRNPPESGRPFVELEYIKKVTQLTLSSEAEGEREWTVDRDQAESFEWDAAQALAAEIGFPAHAVTVSRDDWRPPEDERHEPDVQEIDEAQQVPPPPPRQAKHQPAWMRRHMTAEETYERLERQGLA